MDDTERYALIQQILQKRSGEAYAVRCAANSSRGLKRSKLQSRANDMEATCDTARSIFGENVPLEQREERIKALFLNMIISGRWGVGK